MSTVLAAFQNIQDSEAVILALEHRGFEARELSLLVKNETMHTLRKSSVSYHESGYMTSLSTEGSPFDYLLANALEMYDPDIGILTLSGPLAMLIQISEVLDSPLLRMQSYSLKSGLTESLQRLELTEEESLFLTSYIQKGNILLGVCVFKGEENAVASLFSQFDPEMISVLPGSDSAQVISDGHVNDEYQLSNDNKDTVYFSEISKPSKDANYSVKEENSVNVVNSLMKKLKKLLS